MKQMICGDLSLKKIVLGSKIIAANALSRLDTADTPNPVKSVNKHYGLEDEDILYSTNYKTIMQNQKKDQEFMKIIQTNKEYSIQNFLGAIRNILSSVEIAKL